MRADGDVGNRSTRRVRLGLRSLCADSTPAANCVIVGDEKLALYAPGRRAGGDAHPRRSDAGGQIAPRHPPLSSLGFFAAVARRTHTKVRYSAHRRREIIAKVK